MRENSENSGTKRQDTFTSGRQALSSDEEDERAEPIDWKPDFRFENDTVSHPETAPTAEPTKKTDPAKPMRGHMLAGQVELA